MAALKKLPFVGKVVLGGLKNPWPHIKKEKPNVIALGYDQKPYVDFGELKKVAKVVRLKPHKAFKYKSSKIRLSLSEPSRTPLAAIRDPKKA